VTEPLQAVPIADLFGVLEPAYPDCVIRSIEARPFEYATSFGLTVVTVTLDHGHREVLVMKDFERARMLPAARRHRTGRPASPCREIDAYRHVLAPAGIGPRCRASVVDPVRRRYWLFLEKVAGVELWQVGDPAVWDEVARWLGAMHVSFADRWPALSAPLPTLDAEWFAAWHRRAAAVLWESADPRAVQLWTVLERGGLAARLDAELAAMPTTLVHGELYPSNVMVGTCEHGDGTSPVRVVPIDWETAAIGPPMLDLAALTGGWDAATRARLGDAYGPKLDREALAWCRLHLALRWIALAAGWNPPAEHRQDWIGEALEISGELSA
jgi:hypothetical protein